MRKPISDVAQIPIKLALFSLFAATTFGSTGAVGCYAENCADSAADYGPTVTADPLMAYRGHVFGNMWESSAIDDEWVPFPPRRVMHIQISDFLDGQPPIEMTAYISPSKTPNAHPSDNFTMGAGNVAIFSLVSKDGLTIENSSCSHYYVRVVVTKANR